MNTKHKMVIQCNLRSISCYLSVRVFQDIHFLFDVHGKCNSNVKYKCIYNINVIKNQKPIYCMKIFEKNAFPFQITRQWNNLQIFNTLIWTFSFFTTIYNETYNIAFKLHNCMRETFCIWHWMKFNWHRYSTFMCSIITVQAQKRIT